MKKIDRDLIVDLSHDLKFALTPAEEREILEESETFLLMMEHLERIDTEDVLPMSYPFETPTTWLREDVVSHVISQEEAMLNAPAVDGDYFEVVKVVHK